MGRRLLDRRLRLDAWHCRMPTPPILSWLGIGRSARSHKSACREGAHWAGEREASLMFVGGVCVLVPFHRDAAWMVAVVQQAGLRAAGMVC